MPVRGSVVLRISVDNARAGVRHARAGLRVLLLLFRVEPLVDSVQLGAVVVELVEAVAGIVGLAEAVEELVDLGVEEIVDLPKWTIFAIKRASLEKTSRLCCADEEAG